MTTLIREKAIVESLKNRGIDLELALLLCAF